jgi:hypothetical protein
MDTPTPPSSEARKIHVQMPAPTPITWDRWLRRNNWKMKPFNYFNTRTREYKRVDELAKEFTQAIKT